ncbi:hypothetical protein [Serinibacter arcticus]|uniref:hypothetical protein n=1 Tax=Serinibacter arcticus TaxID=1655435 RepID=UPI0018EEB3EA|nr:hypothetical protein [Serinibacter arcticus]
MELVEDHEVGLEAVHAGLRQGPTEAAGEPSSATTQVGREPVQVPRVVAKKQEVVEGPVCRDRVVERIDDAVVEVAGQLVREGLDVVLVEALTRADRSLEEHPGHSTVRRRRVHQLIEDEREHGSLRRRTGLPAAFLERRTRGE